jgi:Flp pilus assembly protein TadG
MIHAVYGNLVHDRRANVAMIFAFMAIPMVFAVGMAIDYGSAARLKSKLNTAADAAVLAAVTPAMMTQTDAASKTAATNMFKAQVVGLPRLIFDIANTTNFNVNIADVGLAYIHPIVLGRGKSFFAGPRSPLRLVASDLMGEDTVRLTYVPA